MVPEVGLSSARIMRASVDLPQPERPTSATDAPGFMVSDTSSTARTGVGAREQRLAPAGIVARDVIDSSSRLPAVLIEREVLARAGTCIEACASWRV